MKTILLIEDNAEMRENTAEILELAKYKVITAPNGKEGVKLAQTKKPDMIVCDIMMPELDGYGVLHMLSNDTTTASIPFIFLTAKAEKGDYRLGMSMGADDYLTKPYDDMELLKAVETRLKKSEILRSEYSKDLSGLDAFFSEARSLEELAKLSENRKTKSYKKKELIFTEGNYPVGVYFISKGKVKTFKSNEDGREFITGMHKEGDFIGYAALLEESSYSESATSLEESELCLIPKDDFFALLYSNRDVANRFIRMLANNLQEKEAQLIQLAYNSVRKRLAEALLKLRDQYKKGSDKTFSIAIAREDLANMVGTATETVIRTLSDFKEEGIVDVKGSSITLVNDARLEKMKN